MKKIILLAAVVLSAAFGAKAQEVVTPEAGDFSAEIQFNPFSNNFTTFKMPNLQGRYFLTDKDAIRFGLGFSVNTEKENNDVENSELWSKNRVGKFSINLGYERHFFNYKRVDLYAGAGLAFALQSTLTTTQDEFDNHVYQVKTYNNDSYNEFTARVFTGIDFYVYKGLYLGAELGIKVGVKNIPGSYQKGHFNDQGNWNDSDKFNEAPKSNAFVLGTYAEPALRLGWTF